MANVITTLLKADSTQFKTGMKQAQAAVKETEGTVAKAKVGISSFWSGLSAGQQQASIVGATVALGAFAKASVSAASDLEESINAVNVTFGESSAKILEFGENAAKSVGLAQSEFNQLATPLGSILKNAGFQMDEVADKTITLTQRAADMASVFNKDVDQALGAIQAGLRGEADPLEQFGVGLSAAKVEARALADTGKDTAKSLTDQEKQLARINLILDQTNQTAGDFAETSDGLANQTRILKAEFKDLQAEAGKQLVPVLSTLAGALLDVQDAAVKANSALDDLPGDISLGGINRGQLGAFGLFVRAAREVKDELDGGGDAADVFAERVDRMADSVNDGADAVDTLGSVAAELGPRWSAASIPLEGASGAMAEMKSQADVAADAVDDLGDSADDAADKMDPLSEAIQGVRDAIDEAFGGLEEDLDLLDLFDNIQEQFEKIAEAAKEANDPAGIRDFNREVRTLQEQLLDMVRTRDDLSAKEQIEFVARIRQGDIDELHRVLDDLTKDQFVNIIPVTPQHDAFHSGNVAVDFGAGTATPIFNQPSGPSSSSIINQTIIYPVGSTPTTTYQNQVIDDRRNGAR